MLKKQINYKCLIQGLLCSAILDWIYIDKLNTFNRRIYKKLSNLCVLWITNFVIASGVALKIVKVEFDEKK